jgi:hypothetical protein
LQAVISLICPHPCPGSSFFLPFPDMSLPSVGWFGGSPTRAVMSATSISPSLRCYINRNRTIFPALFRRSV